MNRTQIKSMANSASYTKGLDLYREDKVMEFSVEEIEEDYHYISALVKGSGRNIYEVHMEVDCEEDWLEEAYCECPAFSSYNGLCKHCVAVLLEYVDYVSRHNAIEEYAKKREKNLELLQEMKGMRGLVKKNQQIEQPKTPAVFKDLLVKQRLKRELPILEEETYGKVRLEPFLTCTDTEIKVEFKIGIERMYVVQDILSFMRNMDNRAEYSYGTKLKFIHDIDMFEEESRPLVRFLQNWMLQNGGQAMRNSYYGTYMTPTVRAVPLKVGELELFLDAIGDREISGTISGQQETVWRRTDEPLPRTMTLTGKAGGVELEINRLFGYQGVFSYLYFDHGNIYRIPKAELEPIGDFLSAMAGISQRKVFIQQEDVPVFCRELLPELEKQFACTKEQFQEEDYRIVPVTFIFYFDAPRPDLFTCKPVAVYGEREYDIYGNTADSEQRDMVEEIAVRKMVSSFCNAYDDVGHMMAVSRDEEKQYELLVRGIPKFQELGEVYISDALKKIHIIRPQKVSVGVSLSGDLLELSMTAGEMSRAQLIELLSKYDRKKKYYRLKNGDFVTGAGEAFQELLELKEGLKLSDAQLRQETVVVPRYRALYLDESLNEWKEASASKNKGFKTLIQTMKTVDDNDFHIPDSMAGVLRDYQSYGFLWIKTLKNNGFGGILADDMGLGKTLQVIAFLESEFQEAATGENRRTLIVSPASLVFNWESEIKKFAPDLPVKLVVGTAQERRSLIQSAGEREILLTSYDLLKRDLDHYGETAFFCQIIDEAQYIKNHSTQAAKAVKSVRAGFKLALTGTPVENRLSELWSIFDYLMPGFLYSYQRFKTELEQPIVQGQDEPARIRLQKMIRPFVLRRLKRDVLTELPDKLEKCVFAKLEGEQQKLYDAHVKRMKLMLEKQSDEEFQTSKIQILSELTKLRQICCNPGLLFEQYQAESVKTELCLELIQNAVSGGHKILLFSQFTSMLDLLQEQMKAQKISFYTLTGTVSKEKRARMVEQFNEDDTSVFCISLKAGGTGLNLTAADIVIHYDPWWNLAVQNQATDRAHRIGQTNVVTVYKLLVKDTIEENIVKLQEKKRELADQILSGEGMGSGSFSREELLELL